jgi:hypothetical protein
VGVAGVVIIIYSLIMTICSSALGWGIEIGMFFFCILILLLHTIPSLPGSEYQSSFYRLLRIVIFPMTTISFPEVLLADALCSLSKVLKDVGTTMITIWAFLRQEDVIVYHDMAMILVALFASLPFWYVYYYYYYDDYDYLLLFIIWKL